MTEQDWRREMTILSVLYLMQECNRQFPTDLALITDEMDLDEKADLSFLEQTLKEMFLKDLLEIKGAYWIVTDKGRGVLRKIVEWYDHILQFEIFGAVLLTRNLTPDEAREDDQFLPRNHIYDPRFLGPKEELTEEAEDLRIAMLTFLVDQNNQHGDDGQQTNLDPRRVVFVQKLIDGELRSPSFFFDLLVGTFFNEIEEIVNSAYQWMDIVDPPQDPENPDDVAAAEEEAVEIMRVLYSAGLLEQQKRDGNECSECGIPLGAFEADAKADGRTIDVCPECGADYRPQTVTVMEEVEIPGQYEEEIVYDEGPVYYEEDVVVPCWSYDYYDNYDDVYDPYYYDPYADPLADAAFLCLCAALW